MKNTKRILRASEAEKIRSVLEEVYIEFAIDQAITYDNRWDDPGDYERDTERINELGGKLDRIEKAIDYLGGLSPSVTQTIRDHVYG